MEGVKLNIDRYHQKWYQKAVDIGKTIGSDPKMPRLAGLSKHRDNTPANSAEEYFRRSITLPCLNEVSIIYSTVLVLSVLFTLPNSRLICL